MPLMRRTLVAFVVTFCSALAVFTLPSIAWNSLRAEQAPAAVQDSGQAILIATPAPEPAIAFIRFLADPSNARHWKDGGFEPANAG